jgi:hypothetical protein
MLSCAIRGGKCFLTQKLPLKTAAAKAESFATKNWLRGAAPPWRGAALKAFGDQLAYKSRFLLFVF